MTLHQFARQIGADTLRNLCADLPSGVEATHDIPATPREELRYLRAQSDLGFFEGAGFAAVANPAILHPHIERIYGKPLEELYRTAGERLAAQLLRCEGLAKQLGILTGRLFAAGLVRPGPGAPAWRASLGSHHLETARQLLGLNLKSRMRAGDPALLDASEPEDCPLCY